MIELIRGKKVLTELSSEAERQKQKIQVTFKKVGVGGYNRVC